MTRVPPVQRDDLSAAEQPILDHILATRGATAGPFTVLMHHPLLCERVAAIGEQLRFHSVLSDAERELAILTAGREIEALYEWWAHEPIGLKGGLSAATIDVVRHRQPSDHLPERERSIVDAVRALWREHQLTDEQFAALDTAFGRQGLVEIIVIAGYYGLIGQVLNGFDVGIPEGATPAFAK